jgi:hypothetical protein
MTYRVVRYYQSLSIPPEVIATGLAEWEAQAHCNSPEASSSTCTRPEGIERTEEYGAWFDGYTRESA